MSDQSPVRHHVVIDAEHFDRTMGMVLERLEALQINQADAFAAGFREVIRDPQTWETVTDKVAAVARKRADAAAAKGFWWVLRKGVLVAVLLTVIFFSIAKIFGWEVAAKVARTLSTLFS
jgi:hypothetical protein